MDDIKRIRLTHGLDLSSTDEQATAAVDCLKVNLTNALRKYGEFP